MRAAKLDGTHRPIVQALEQMGCSVLSLAGVGKGAPDLLVGWRGTNYLLEIKDPSTARGKRGPSELQRAWAASWRGRPVSVVYAVDEALDVVVGSE